MFDRNSCQQNSLDTDQTPSSAASENAASDLGLHCLPSSQRKGRKANMGECNTAHAPSKLAVLLFI